MTDEMNAVGNLTIEQKLKRITFDDLRCSVRSVADTGRVGTPVNVRLHWEFPESEARLPDALFAAVAIADEVLRMNEPSWRVRRHASGRTLNVLGSDLQGRTLMVTLVAGSIPGTALTVFGNHGIVRLEDGWVALNSIPDSFEQQRWVAGLMSAVSESHD